jgi:hypothetical protein
MKTAAHDDRQVVYARHLRTQLQHRHADNPRFLEILFSLTDEQLLSHERAHHEAKVRAIKASAARRQSGSR